MKALTLRHPWPWCVVSLGKRIENRSWRPPSSQIKPGHFLAIHGGVRPRGEALEEAEDVKAWIGEHVDRRIDDLTLEGVILPGIVAVCRLGEVVEESDDPWFCGPFGWTLLDLVILEEPVPCRGAQGLWEVPDDVLIEVRSRYLAARSAVAS